MNLENINNQSNKASDEISLKELFITTKIWFQYILSKWILITAIGIIGGVVGVMYAYFNKPIYIASTTFVLEEGNSGGGALGSLGGLASMVGVDLGGGGGGIFQGDNILELYKSRSMIEKTLLTQIELNGSKQLMIDRYISFNKLREKWNKKLELSKIQFELPGLSSKKHTRLQDSVLSIIVNDISNNYLSVSKPDKKLSIIKAEVRAKDEPFAKSFNDEIVKNVNDFYVQTKTKKSLENVAILQQKTDSVRNVMNGSIYNAAAVADATPNLNPTRQVQRIAPIQRAQFSAETNKAMLAELVKNLELSKISLHKETPLIQVIDYPIFPLTVVIVGKVKSVVFGIVLGVFIGIVIFTFRLIFKQILNDN